MMARTLEAEWLDTLPEQDARAMRSRRDLVRVNALMGNAAIVAALMKPSLPERALRIAEIGAGDGAFAARVVRKLGGSGDIVLVDRGARPSTDAAGEMARRGWRVEAARADVFDWLAAAAPLDAIFANLFLHHFDDAGIARMLRAIARCAPLFVACEPHRSRVALAGAHLLGVVGCNDVTRHDAVVSVRAGFTGRELSALWRDATGPAATGTVLVERACPPFSHGFRAARADGVRP